ncbi:MAG: hypothetical protein J6W52_01300 [Bacteroidaceae bacterium]|nr:hypothetical protein [Bacteroidaceae bacterium]
MLKVALLTLGIVAISIALLCVKLIVQPNGKFASSHIGDNKEMRKRGIHCVQSMDRMMRRENLYKVKERI